MDGHSKVHSVIDYCPTPAAMGWSSARRLQELGIFFFDIILLLC